LKYIKPELRENPNVMRFLEFLSSVLKKRLKEKWFDADTATIGKWKKKPGFCNVNDIFQELQSFLNDPESDILHFFEPKNGKISVSKYFENDTQETVKLELNGIFLRMLGTSQEETIQKLLPRFLDFSQNKAKALRQQIQQLREIKNRIVNKK